MARFAGIPYPVRRHPLGYFHAESGISQIKSDLLILLLTNPGERVFLPAFGTPLRQLVFESNDSLLREKARNMIINSIRTYEPRVVIQQLDITNRADLSSLHPEDDRTEVDQVLSIRIVFVDPENLQEVQELKLDVPLTGG